MTPIKCDKCELYYDGDKYESCPHCQDDASGKVPLPKPTFPRTVKRKTTEKQVEIVQNDVPKKKKGFLMLFKSKNKLDNAEKNKDQHLKKQNEKESKVMSERPKEKSINPQEKRIEPKKTVEDDAPIKVDMKPENEIKKVEVQVAEKMESNLVQQTSNTTSTLAAAIQNAGSKQDNGDLKTVAKYNFSNSIDPVVGWLICIKGEYFGESFNIKEGNNCIGRSMSMDIAFPKDTSISRERHAVVVFEPNKGVFYLKSGESSGLTYLNGELLLLYKELSDYDRISLGNSEFIFMHFAGDKFVWDTYNK